MSVRGFLQAGGGGGRPRGRSPTAEFIDDSRLDKLVEVEKRFPSDRNQESPSFVLPTIRRGQTTPDAFPLTLKGVEN